MYKVIDWSMQLRSIRGLADRIAARGELDEARFLLRSANAIEPLVELSQWKSLLCFAAHAKE